jgi:hypothetical protein
LQGQGREVEIPGAVFTVLPSAVTIALVVVFARTGKLPGKLFNIKPMVEVLPDDRIAFFSFLAEGKVAPKIAEAEPVSV